jgi:hypothetical protein
MFLGELCGEELLNRLTSQQLPEVFPAGAPFSTEINRILVTYNLD